MERARVQLRGIATYSLSSSTRLLFEPFWLELEPTEMPKPLRSSSSRESSPSMSIPASPLGCSNTLGKMGLLDEGAALLPCLDPRGTKGGMAWRTILRPEPVEVVEARRLAPGSAEL